jgi:predicted nucleic acid-binding protein
MTSLPKKTVDVVAVVDTQVFVRAIASQPNEARFYARAIQKCWKFAFSEQITEEYQRVLQVYGFRGDVVIHKLNKLHAMNKYRVSHVNPEVVPDDLAPRKDRHVIAPCLGGDANVVVSNDRGVHGCKQQIQARTKAIVLTSAEAEKMLDSMPDCYPSG